MSSINSGQSLGSLGVNVDVLGVDGVANDLKNVERSFKKTADGIKKSTVETKRHGAQSRKLSFVMLELSRGAEDAAVSFGVNGFQGAIRGATNNISQMFSIISPLAGTIAGFAGAGVASIAVMVGMAKRAREAAGGIDELSEALQRRNKIIEQGLRLEFDIADIVQGGDVKGAKRKLLDAQRQLNIERRILKGPAPEFGVGGLEREREREIRKFGSKLGGERGFTTEKNRAVLLEIGKRIGLTVNQNLLRKERRAVAEGAIPVALATGKLLDAQRIRIVEQVRAKLLNEEIPAGKIEAGIIRAPKETQDAFKEFLGPIAKLIRDITSDVAILEKAVQAFRVGVEEAEKSPAAQKKRQEQQQKEEEKRLTGKEKLRRELFAIVEPEASEEEIIDIRFRERIDRIKKFVKDPGDRARFREATFDAFSVEEKKRKDKRQKVIDDEQRKVENAREKEAKGQQRVEAEKKKNLDAARSLGLGFAKQFIPKDDLREIQLQERLRRIDDLKISPKARGSLRELARLTLDETKKQAPQFAGVTEFAKQFQLQISGRTDPVEKNTAEIVKLTKQLIKAVKNPKEDKMKQGN